MMHKTSVAVSLCCSILWLACLLSNLVSLVPFIYFVRRLRRADSMATYVVQPNVHARVAKMSE